MQQRLAATRLRPCGRDARDTTPPLPLVQGDCTPVVIDNVEDRPQATATSVGARFIKESGADTMPTDLRGDEQSGNDCQLIWREICGPGPHSGRGR